MAGNPKKRERLERWRAWSAKPGAIEELCDWIATGGHLLGFSQKHDFAYRTVDAWIQADGDRAALYARARELRADVKAAELEDIADEPIPKVMTQYGEHLDSAAVAHQKLRIDTRRWAAAKLNPRRYSEKVEIEAKHTHDVIGELRDFLLGNNSRLPIGGPTGAA